jgi:hypothetical protein
MMDLLKLEALIPRQALDLVEGYRTHAPIERAAEPQRNGEEPAGFREPRHFAKGALAI